MQSIDRAARKHLQGTLLFATVRLIGGALFPGDALQVVSDRRHVTFMYSYPNFIPMGPTAVQTIRKRVADLAFEDVYGYTWGRNILGGARSAVDASFDRYFRAVAA